MLFRLKVFLSLFKRKPKQAERGQDWSITLDKDGLNMVNTDFGSLPEGIEITTGPGDTILSISVVRPGSFQQSLL